MRACAPTGSSRWGWECPISDPRSLPFDTEGEAPSYHLELATGPVEFGAVSVGNPHAVIRVRSVREKPR